MNGAASRPLPLPLPVVVRWQRCGNSEWCGAPRNEWNGERRITMKPSMGTEPGAQGPTLDLPTERPAEKPVPSAAYILVVDDDHAIRGVLEDLLDEEHCPSLIASSGAEALARAPAAPPALILLDRSLPGEPVGEVAAALRARAGWSEVPLALFTGVEHQVATGLARELGAVEVIEKPFNVVDLLAVLERYRAPSQLPADAEPSE